MGSKQITPAERTVYDRIAGECGRVAGSIIESVSEGRAFLTTEGKVLIQKPGRPDILITIEETTATHEPQGRIFE